jgi:CRISPR-associated protein Cmr3
MSSASLPQLAVLAEEDDRAKPASSWWLTQEGWRAYLAGAALRVGKRLEGEEHLVHSSQLWKIDERVGIGLSPEHGRADDGKLFTAQAIALNREVGFLAAVVGAEPPGDGVLRFGGDGRAAAVQLASGYAPAEPDYAAIARAGRCRVVLTSPGLFAGGWMLPGVNEESRAWQLGEVRGRLVCAAVPRAETVSGWDLARWQPKPAQRVAPTGSVYWIDELQATPEALRKLSEAGLWTSVGENPARRAEGFNRISFALA